MDAPDSRDERLLATFLDLVRIDSPSGREAAVAAYCARTLSEAGFEISFDGSEPATGSDTGNLVAHLPATGPGPALVLSAHMDCVQPCEGVRPVVEDGVVRSEGDTVLGADDKAGVAAILEAVRRLAEGGGGHTEVRVVLTVAEELGLVGAKALDPGLVRGDLCLVLDADGAVGGIVTATPTHYTFRADFTGRAAHAGVRPEEGVSAVAMASRAVSSIEIGRLDAETTANFGRIEGGTATNVVAAEALLTGECRSIDPARVEVVRREMDDAVRDAAAFYGGTVEIEWTREYVGFRFAEDDPLLELVSGACRDAGIEPRTFATGGGSDGNIFTAAGVPTLVLSCGMDGVHGPDESIEVEQLTQLARLVDAVLARVAG